MVRRPVVNWRAVDRAVPLSNAQVETTPVVGRHPFLSPNRTSLDVVGYAAHPCTGVARFRLTFLPRLCADFQRSGTVEVPRWLVAPLAAGSLSVTGEFHRRAGIDPRGSQSEVVPAYGPTIPENRMVAQVMVGVRRKWRMSRRQRLE